MRAPRIWTRCSVRSVRPQPDLVQEIVTGSFYMKREPLGNEHNQDRWIGNMLRGSAAPTEACLDTEALAAWADGGLDAKASAAVELHASNCQRCTAVLATMARTAPAASPAHAWTRARVVRWLVPMMGAATAIAIWIAVPDRTMTPIQPAPAHDLSVGSERGTQTAESATPNAKEGTPDAAFGTANTERGKPSMGSGTANVERGTRNLEPGTRNVEPRVELRADAPSVRQNEVQMRDESRRERVAPTEAQDAAAAAPFAVAPEAAGPPPPAPPTPSARPSAAEPSAPVGAEVQIGTLRESTASVARTM